jgi:uncharacterized membrane protein YedE/YeeE
MLLALNGHVAGISGIVGHLLRGTEERRWRWVFLAGLLVGGLPFALRTAESSSAPPLALVGLAGLMVGFGSRLAGGCTSGHGVCGVSRSYPRSLVATLVFITTGALVVALTRGLGGSW